MLLCNNAGGDGIIYNECVVHVGPCGMVVHRGGLAGLTNEKCCCIT